MKYIDLIKYPTIGEVVFPDEPNEVYINRYALPRFRRNRQVLFDLVHTSDRVESTLPSWSDPQSLRRSQEPRLVLFPERKVAN